MEGVGGRIEGYNNFHGGTCGSRILNFEALVGDSKGQYSIRINDQWRICFEWADRAPGPANVEIVDYH
jgi:plasmid maintenance system killer protein